MAGTAIFFLIGGRTIIHYGAEGARHQMREIRAGGGVHSFDAPFAHFGLGDFETLQRVEIRGSGGTTSMISKPLPVNREYRIARD